MAKITEKIPSLQKLLEDGKLEKQLRSIAGSDQQMNFSVSITPQSTSYSFSATAADGTNENYSKSTPYVAETPSPSPTT